jgi:8-oxo-dGTP pyrophosphatase MutT (NUDIX family)
MERKQLERLKLKFTMPLPGKISHSKMMPDGRLLIETSANRKNAAVVILIFQSSESIDEIVLIKRTEYEGHHSGQISFPGGKEDPDDESFLKTAIRECYEEIGVKLTVNELIGALTPLFVIVSEFLIYPYVFYLPSEPSFNIDKSEVNYIIRFPFNKLTEPSLRKEKMMNLFGTEIMIPYYDIQMETVWGATAMILSEFIDLIQKHEI